MILDLVIGLIEGIIPLWCVSRGGCTQSPMVIFFSHTSPESSPSAWIFAEYWKEVGVSASDEGYQP